MSQSQTKVVRLSDVSLGKGEYGSGASAIQYDPGKPRYVRITDIDENGRLKEQDPRSPNVTEPENFLEKGDFLFARSGSIGRTYVHDRSDKVYQYAGYLIRFKLDRSQIDPKYLFYLTKSRMYWNWIEKETKLVTIANINAQQYARFSFPLPTLSEQKRIVTTLDRVEAARNLRRQVDELANSFLKAVFCEMFGNPVANSLGWDLAKLVEVGDLARGKSRHRPRNDPRLLGGKYPLIQTGDVTNSGGYITTFTQTYSELGLGQSRMWPSGTLCITIAANIARTGILTFDACFPDSVVGFTPNERATTEYIQHWMSFVQKRLEDSAPESAQKNINLRILENLEVPIPPIHLQRRFGKIVEETQRLRSYQSQSKSHLDNLFNVLMQQSLEAN